MTPNAHDILYFVLALSVAVLTVFISIILYYVARAFREGYAMIRHVGSLVESVRAVIARWEQLTATIEQRVGGLSGVLTSVSDLLMRILDARTKKKSSKGK